MREVEVEMQWSQSPAGSRFRVLAMTDDLGHDLRGVVPEGRSYASLEELRQELAEALAEDVLVVEANSTR